MPKKRICIILESEEELLDMIRKEGKGRFRDRLRLLRTSENREGEKHDSCFGTLWYYIPYCFGMAPPL